MPVAVVALLWNLLGCVAYLMGVMMSAEQLAELSEAEQAIQASRPVWSIGATAIAAWFGALGSLGLILRHRWAVPVLTVSLLGVIVQDLELFLLNDGVALAGGGVYAVQGAVLLIAVGLVLLARRARAAGWIA
jgi:hypothetical protein